MNVGSRITVSTILIVLHKSHLSADGAKSAVGMATAGRSKKLSGDACDACDAFSYYTVYGEKIYSLENMFFE
jgi:hypothetical protein